MHADVAFQIGSVWQWVCGLFIGNKKHAAGHNSASTTAGGLRSPVSAGIDSIARRCTKEEFEAMSHEKLTDLVCRNLGCLVVIEEESRIVEEFYRLAKTEVIKAVRHRESTAAILKAFRARIEVLFAQPEDLRDQEELDDLCWKTHCLEKNHSCPADTCLDADEIVRRARVNIDKRKTSKITQFVDAVYRYFYGVEGANLASFTDFLLAQATPPTKYEPQSNLSFEAKLECMSPDEKLATIEKKRELGLKLLKVARTKQTLNMSKKGMMAMQTEFDQESETASIYIEKEREYMQEWLKIDPGDSALVERNEALAAAGSAIIERNGANQLLKQSFAVWQDAEQQGTPGKLQVELLIKAKKS